MSPAQGLDDLMEAGFSAKLLFQANGVPVFIVQVPSTNQQYTAELDEADRADCTAIVTELLETVTQEALALQECECEHDQSLRHPLVAVTELPKDRRLAYYETFTEVNDASHWGCGSCGRCEKCGRRIKASEFDAHAWWCVNDKYRRVFTPPVERAKPVQLGLF